MKTVENGGAYRKLAMDSTFLPQTGSPLNFRTKARRDPAAKGAGVSARENPSRLPRERTAPSVPRRTIASALGEAKQWREVPSI